MNLEVTLSALLTLSTFLYQNCVSGIMERLFCGLYSKYVRVGRNSVMAISVKNLPSKFYTKTAFA